MRPPASWHETGVRWLKFNAVGGMGVAVQLGMLALLTHTAEWNFLGATAIAVEAALLHNFAWHERYTWADRTRNARALREVTRRLLAFHAGNGAVSLVGNLVIMAWLTGIMGVPAMVANVVSIVVCSLVNFAIGDRLIFRDREADASALAGLATAYCLELPGGAADLHARASFVGHANQIPLRERKKQQRCGGGESEADTDAGPQ